MLLEDGDCIIKMPLFKFLEKKFAKKLINEGCIRLTKLTEFRDTQKYSDQIHDPLEGILEIKNHFDYYKGLAKDGTGLIPFLFDPMLPVECVNGEMSCTVKVDNFLIYCTSQELFTDSMIQAFKDKKDACVLIKDPNKFFDIISQSCPHLNFLGNRYCNYKIGKKLFEKNPVRNSNTEKIMKYPVQAAWLKPKEYANQVENRAIWSSKKNIDLESIIICRDELKDLVMEIDIENVNEEALKNNRNLAVGVIVKHTNGKVSTLTMQRPNKIICPVINYLKGEERPYLGLLCYVQDHTIKNVNIITQHIIQTAFTFTKFGAILINTFLDEVEKISFYTMDEPIKLRSQFLSLHLGKFYLNFNNQKYNIDISSFNEEVIPRYIIHFAEPFQTNTPSILVINKINGIWNCLHRSLIQDKELAIEVGKIIDDYFVKNNYSEIEN